MSRPSCPKPGSGLPLGSSRSSSQSGKLVIGPGPSPGSCVVRESRGSRQAAQGSATAAARLPTAPRRPARSWDRGDRPGAARRSQRARRRPCRRRRCSRPGAQPDRGRSPAQASAAPHAPAPTPQPLASARPQRCPWARQAEPAPAPSAEDTTGQQPRAQGGAQRAHNHERTNLHDHSVLQLGHCTSEVRHASVPTVLQLGTTGTHSANVRRAAAFGEAGARPGRRSVACEL